ncbi:MAG: ATP-binding protein [archaeon GB-1867-035]|nr:ATP-binding protein [Candidatus Culexmicrobium profundum]
MAKTKIGIPMRATTSEVYAIIDKDAQWLVREGDYVFIEGENCPTYFCQIVKLERLHKLLSDLFSFGATALLTAPERARIILQQWDTAELLKRMGAIIKPLGVIEDSELGEVSQPPPVGEDAVIFKVTGEELSKLMEIEEPKLFIGYYRGTNDPFYLSLNKLIEHMAIIAMTRAGKSYLVGVILEELLYHGNVACVIIDPKGEYPYMREKASKPEDPILAERWEKIDTSNIKVFYPPPSERFLRDILTDEDREWGFELAKLTITDFQLLDRQITDAQLRLLDDVLEPYLVERLPEEDRELREFYLSEGYNYDPRQVTDINFIIDLLMRHTIDARLELTRRVLIQRLRRLNRMNLFSKAPRPDEVVKKGQISIIALPGLTSEQRTLFVTAVLKTLRKAREEGSIPCFLLILEEAHLYAPSVGSSPAKDEVSTIARLGASKQLGIGLIAITQRPVRLDTDLYSQVGTMTLMRIRNEEDLRSLKQNVEEVASDYIDILSSFKTGEALIAGKGVRDVPRIIKVRPRITKHGGETAKLYG